jgi:nitroreductase
MDALTAIAERHSSRSFNGVPIAREVLEKLVDAGRRAPTARNEQPWEFVVVTEAGTRKKLGALGDYTAPLTGAAACIAVFCKDVDYYLEDGCAAAQNILIAATALRVQSCWIAGDKKPYGDEAANLLGVPKGVKLVALLALGYAREVGAPPKRDLSSVLHWERF